ncbi:MlaE family ABC transporter permease [Haliangium sp.]|uniref:MlaE family ABC transporter permease n=1 Tax=Haliangium sp. TaxID=2663208 RepID=UPI003D09C81C
MSDAPTQTSLLDRIGAPMVAAGRWLGGLVVVFADVLAGLTRGGRRRGEVARQMYFIGNRSLLFIAATLGFFGMVFIYQIAIQLDRIAGDVSLVGAQFIKVVCRDLGPSLTAMMLATRVGAGIAAEIGSMQVTEQIDALRMSDVRPVDYLLVPRFLASIVMTIVLAVFGSAIAYTAGGLTAWVYFDLNPLTYFDLSQVGYTQVGQGLVKAFCYGASIPIIAGYAGLRARGGAEGVGRATTEAVIGGSIAVLMWDFILSLTAITLLGEQV